MRLAKFYFCLANSSGGRVNSVKIQLRLYSYFIPFLTVLFFYFSVQTVSAYEQTLFEAIESEDINKLERLNNSGRLNWNKTINFVPQKFYLDPELKARIKEKCRILRGSPLVFASACGKPRAVHWLIEHGSDPDGVNYYTPLYAAAYRGHLDIVKQLIAAGANPVKFTEFGVTALHVAAQMGHTSIARYLLDLNPESINTITHEQGKTPLLCTLDNMRDDRSGIYSLLLAPELHADLGIADNIHFWTALHKACDCAGLLKNGCAPVIIRMILDHPGFDYKLVHTQDINGYTPIELARGNRVVENLLIKAGAVCNPRN